MKKQKQFYEFETIFLGVFFVPVSDSESTFANTVFPNIGTMWWMKNFQSTF